MRPMEKPVASHDNDLLLAVDAHSFREWLVRQSVRVRSAKGADKGKGILFWVRPTGTPAWLSVDAPRTADGKYVSTHRNLRSYLNDFLLKPLTSSMRQAKRQAPAVANTNGLSPVPQAVRAAPAKNAAAVTLPTGGHGAQEPAVRIVDEESRVKALKQPQEAKKRCAAACSGSCVRPAAPAPVLVLDDRLEDLRDDFALHAPLEMETGESLQAFAARRWEYARVMMEARPANVRG